MKRATSVRVINPWATLTQLSAACYCRLMPVYACLGIISWSPSRCLSGRRSGRSRGREYIV
jgi:hypothetical protein